MCRYGAYLVEPAIYRKHTAPVDPKALAGAEVDAASGRITKDGQVLGVQVQGQACAGFPTPSRKQEFYSPTLEEWGWPEYAVPGYVRSHIDQGVLDKTRNEYVLLPTFRLPNHIHSRSGNAKWLVEIAHRNPIWMNTLDAERMGFRTDDAAKLVTDIGWFVDKVWVTEAIRPGVIACSHHIGRWKLAGHPGANSWGANTVQIDEEAPGQWHMRRIAGVEPFESADPDSARIHWRDGGVHQNITHAVHPDPMSGMHCWHQRVRVEKPAAGENYGDVFVDTSKSMDVYREWLAMTRTPERADGLRRPLWLNRPLRPVDAAFYKKK
jgi:anaerobic selenocysteine-containing dehydrogenase